MHVIKSLWGSKNTSVVFDTLEMSPFGGITSLLYKFNGEEILEHFLYKFYLSKKMLINL